jgi:hypothetical protein
MSGNDWLEVTGAIGIFALLITVITVTVWQVAATWRARAALARDQEYKHLAETALRVQAETDRQLVAIEARLTETRDRLTSVERLLKEVE